MTAPVAPKAIATADKTVQLDVALLGRDYKVACKESERAELVEAVALLDRRMREIRDAGKIAGVERVAVMAALNLAHELMRAKAGAGHQRRTARGGKAGSRTESARRKFRD